MKIKWLVADVTAVGSSDIAESTYYLGSDFGWGIVLANSGRIGGLGATL